ncbi:18075_t:CDS:2, partial [Cetraspora pellucida]
MSNTPEKIPLIVYDYEKSKKKHTIEEYKMSNIPEKIPLIVYEYEKNKH